MPIKVQSDLPAREILERENIFVMDENRAVHQDIRPIHIAILNLMPLKEDTELQLLRSLSNTPLQVDVTFVKVSSHEAKNTSTSHLNKFYVEFNDIRNCRFDGMIITGAPVELMEFEEVDYWEELTHIIDWTETNVTSTIYLCWAAQAGLYYHYGLQKKLLDHKMFGLFRHRVLNRKIPLVRGFDDEFYAPHDRVTLDGEYKRDLGKGLPIDLPENYYPDDNPDNKPLLMWRSHANNLYTNWLNYYVYQVTPYDLDGTPDFSRK